MKHIRYREGYKYVLAEDYRDVIELRSPVEIRTRFITLLHDGNLTIRAGYAWDGPSGPTIDTPDSMRGSLVHDALYQLMRENRLGHEFRECADHILRRICVEDGMPEVRANAWHEAVRLFAGPAIRRDVPVKTAP